MVPVSPLLYSIMKHLPMVRAHLAVLVVITGEVDAWVDKSTMVKVCFTWATNCEKHA